MEPDPDGPFQRVERTLISVWCYISEAVSRFLRPQPVEAVDSDEPGVDGEPADRSQKDDDARGVEVGEEPSLSTVSLVSLSSPVVAWERCAADIDLKPKEEDHENKEDLIEEQRHQTGNEFAELLVTKSAKAHQGSHEKTEIEKCDTCEESLAPENDGQRATGGSGHVWVKDGVIEDMDSKEARPGDHRKVVETLADIEEEAEENSGEESNEKTGHQKVNKASAAILGDANISEDASQVDSGNENLSDEKTKDVETQLRQLPGDDNVQMRVAEEAATAEESEQDKSGRPAEDILTQSGSKYVQKTEPDTTEFTITEEDVLVTIMQTAEEDVSVEEISADLDYEMAEGKNLSAENENSAEQTQQVETLVCKELSSVAEDDRVEEEEDHKSATHEESEERKSSRADEDVPQEENVLAQSVTSSEEEQDLKGNDSAEPLINENMTEHQLELEKKLHTSAERDEAENKEDLEEERDEILEENEEEDLKEESEVKQHTAKEERGNQRECEVAAEMLGDANICEDASQLKSENENTEERLQQVEAQHLVCKELSGVAESERIEEEEPATHEEVERKSSRAVQDVQQEENVLIQSVTSSEDDQEQFSLKGNDSAEQLINENMAEHQLGLEKKLHTSAETEVIEKKEENTANEANYEELEKRGDGDVGEESVSRKREEDVPKVDEVKEELEEESNEIRMDGREKNEEEFEEESEAEQFTTDGETGEQREDEVARAMLGVTNICENASQLPFEKTNNVGTLLPVCKEFENVQMTVFEKEDLYTAANQQTTEESEQDKSRRTNEEENISTQSVTSNEIDQSTEEEQFSQIGNDSADQLITEDTTTRQLGLEKTEIRKLDTCEEIERVENKEDFQEERGEIEEDNRDEDFEEKQHIVKEEREEQKEDEAGAVLLGDANVCEDASQLKSENENSAERTEQVETQHLVCKELSGVVEDEGVEDEESVTCEEEEQDKSSREVEDVRQEENILTQSATSSEADEDTGEEQFDQTDSDQSNDEAKEDLEEERSEIQEDDGEESEKDFEKKSEAPGNNEEETTVGSGHVQLKEGVRDGIESSEEEEYVRLDDRWKVSETLEDIAEDDEEGAEEDSEEESKMQESTPTKEAEDGNEKTEEERDNKASAAMLGGENLSEDASQLNFSDEKTKVETFLPVCKDELTDLNVQMTEDLNQTTDEKLKEDKNRRTIEEEKTEFTFKEDDVTSMHTEKEITLEEISSDVEERLSDKEICMKRVCTTAPVTVKAGGESEREINIGFSNVPSGVIEGQAGLSHELNTKACEETPEAVPEHNNELESDENTTQRFFEGGNSEEIQTIHLPEEVEVFKSSEAGGGEYLLIREGSTEESKKELQVGTLQFAEDTEKPKSDNINLELDHFSEEEKVELLDTSMKTEIKQSDEEFETELEDEGKTAERETNRLPQDVCEKRDAVAADEGVESADETPESPKSEEGKMTQISLGPELVQAFRLEDDRETEPKLFDESATEFRPVRFDTEEQDEVLDLNEITTLQLVGTASDLITGQSALSQRQITTDTETADESETTLGEITNELQETKKHSEDTAEEQQDGIDEEILDLWIETVMSKDTGGIKEDRLTEEPGETSSEEKKEGVMEAISEETETSLTTLDSGFLDQTFSHTQIIKSGDTGLLPDKNDNSEDICEVLTSNSESALIEEMVETLQPYPIAEGASGEIGSCPDSGVSSPEPKHPNQEGGTAEEKQDGTKPETDAVSGDDEEADVTSLTEATESDISSEVQISPLLEEESVLTESPSGDEPQDEPEKRNFSLVAPEEKPSEDLSESFPAPSGTELEEDWSEVDTAMLDFAVQKSRIAVKNPRVRPPTDPRSLIHKPSVDPTPPLPVPGKVPVGLPLGGLGIGIKLPGIGAGFPVLKKTQRPPRHEDNPETQSQESEEKKEEEKKSDAAKKDEVPKRPKWMPPGQPGFGNPLMSELKTKLKKTPKE